jgi:Tol biopolymer transport system component
MATGQQAFHGDSKMSTLAAILNQEPKPISQLVPGIPRDLEKIIARCLRKDPGRRFQIMSDLKVMLDELKEESDSGTLAGTPPATGPARRPWVWMVAGLVVVAIAVTGWLFREGPRKPQAAPEVVPLTSYAGFEAYPSFSLDGNQVAFSWDGEKQDNLDIYVKLIGSPTPLQLTTDPADDVSLTFSPDGRSIGFIRVSKGRATFIVIPAIGGPEHLVAEIPFANSVFDPSVSWLPDGKWVVTDGLALLSTESGETRSMTSPPRKNRHLTFLPPSRQMGARLRSAADVSDIYLLELTEDLKPKGEPKALTSLKGFSFGSAWAPNGTEIIFSSGTFENTSLWKVLTSGAGEPEPLPFTGAGACCPAISRNGNRLSYERVTFDSNIWSLSLSAPGVASAPQFG